MNESIKRRVAELKKLLDHHSPSVMVEWPDGTRSEKSAAEWWEHRHEWSLADFEHQDNSGGLVVLLMLASMMDDGAKEAKAEGNIQEVERLTKEREELLKMYWQE